jgi:hypothetical protein
MWIGALLEDDLDRAAASAGQAEEAFRRLRFSSGLAHALEAKALIALQRGEPLAANSDLAEALRIHSESANIGCASHCLEVVAVHAFRTGNPLVGRELSARAGVLRQRSGQGYSPWELHRRESFGDVLKSAGPPEPDSFTESDISVLTATVESALAHLEEQPGSQGSTVDP